STVSTEAALAIHDDFSIDPALPDLAAALDAEDEHPSGAFLIRAIHANSRVGSPENAARVASWAASTNSDVRWKIFALRCLNEWQDPPMLDAVTGRAREASTRPSTDDLKTAIAPYADELLFAEEAEVQVAAMAMCQQYGLSPAPEVLAKLIAEPKTAPSVRVAALEALMSNESLSSATKVASLSTALETKQVNLRTSALSFLVDEDPTLARDAAKTFLVSQQLAEKQTAVKALADLGEQKIIANLTERLMKGELAMGIQLDVIEAAQQLTITGDFPTWLAARSNIMDPASFQDCLQGGDPDKGQDVFANHLAAQCIRCHKYEKRGPGSIIGPNLWKIGTKDRPYLLESLVAPQKTMAKGYGTITLTRTDGSTVSGLYQGEDKKAIKIKDATSGAVESISLDDITSRTDVISVMPPMGAILQRRELRDLVAYLASLKPS
ncbi:MAG: hypothetical protein AAGJ31_13020, partial [Verrucomicrobiota bacterium]